MILLLKMLIVFIASMAIDLCYIIWFYVSTPGEKDNLEHAALRSGATSVFIGICSLTGLLFIVNSILMIIPNLLGLFFGSYLGVKFRRYLQLNKKVNH